MGGQGIYIRDYFGDMLHIDSNIPTLLCYPQGQQ